MYDKYQIFLLSQNVSCSFPAEVFEPQSPFLHQTLEILLEVSLSKIIVLSEGTELPWH